jgi:hypothetical protein
MEKQVRVDAQKMKAFVRFSKAVTDAARNTTSPNTDPSTTSEAHHAVRCPAGLQT